MEVAEYRMRWIEVERRAKGPLHTTPRQPASVALSGLYTDSVPLSKKVLNQDAFAHSAVHEAAHQIAPVEVMREAQLDLARLVKSLHLIRGQL